MGAADKIENSVVGQVNTPPSGLQEQFFSMCLAKQADSQSRMGLTNSPDTVQRTVDQCLTVSESQALGIIAPPILKSQVGILGQLDTYDFVKQAAEQGEAATIQDTNDLLLKPTEK
jgi:hypothetical protein